MSSAFGTRVTRTTAWALLIAGSLVLAFGRHEKDLTNPYEAGEKFYRAGDCLSAIPLLKAAAAAEPRATFPLGNCLFDAKAYLEAADALALYLQQFPSDTQALHLLAISYEKSGRNSDALNAIHYYVTRHPDSSAGQVELGRFYFDTADKERSAAAFSSALEKTPDDPAALLGLGLIAASDGRWAEAIENLKRASQTAPGAPAPFKALGDVYSRQGKCEEALGPYHHAFELSPSDYATAKSLAKCYFALNKLQDAAKALGPPTPEQAEDLEATEMMGKALAGDSPALSEYLRGVIALNPANTVARQLRAQFVQTDEAMAEYLEILKLEKDHPDPGICYKLAGLYEARHDEARNDLKSAYQYYRTAAESAAATSAMHLALARVDLALNDAVGAQGELTKVGAPENESLGYKMLQVETDLRSNNWDSANSLTTAMLAKDPNDVKLLDLAARVALRQERYEDAAGYLERLFQADTNNKPARYRLARFYLVHPELKRDNRTEELLKDFVARQASDPEAYLLLAELYRGRNDATNANINYELGFSHIQNPPPPSFAWAYTSYAMFLADNKHLDDALANGLRAVELTPDDEHAEFALGLIYIEMRKTAEAQQVIQKLQSLNPELALKLQKQLPTSPTRRPKSGAG